MLHVSSANGANPLPWRKGALQQQSDGVGYFRNGSGGAAIALLVGESRFVDPGAESRSGDVLHDQVRAASPIVEDVVHLWHAGCASVGLSLLVDIGLGTGLVCNARVPPLGERP